MSSGAFGGMGATDEDTGLFPLPRSKGIGLFPLSKSKGIGLFPKSKASMLNELFDFGEPG